MVYGGSVPLHTRPQGYCGRGADQDCKGRAGHVGVECMVTPLKMAVLLLSVHPLPDQCLLHLYLTHMTDLPGEINSSLTYFQAPASDCSYQRGGEACAPLLVMSPSDINSPISGNLPFPREWRLLPCPAPYTVGCRSRTLFQMGELPHPLNYWWLCCWLPALSLVLKLGKHRACRPVGCSPTLVSKLEEGGHELRVASKPGNGPQLTSSKKQESESYSCKELHLPIMQMVK